MIYVIRVSEEDAYKVGFTANIVKLRQRVNHLQIGNHRQLKVIALIGGTQFHERGLHRQMSEWRLRGEWFRKNPIIDSLLSKGTYAAL
jgi:hypothetical protein